jgi:cytochrome c553
MRQAGRGFLIGLVVGLLVVLAMVTQAAAKVVAKSPAPKQIEVCASCHGENEMGSRDAGYPAIAGLPAAYIRAQLKAFRHGARDNVMMGAVAGGVDATQRRALATYLAALKVPLSPPTRGAAAKHPNPIGAALAIDGAPGVPACAACHGAAGLGQGAFPRLAGQPADYLEAQLRAWQTQKRPAGNPPVMPAIARALSKVQIKSVSAYYGALPANPG